MADKETLSVYTAKADEYRSRFATEEPDQGMRDFLAALPEAARVVDLGCGPGQALVHLVAAGHHAEGIDPVPEFVDIAKDVSGAPVTLGTFEVLMGHGSYDGVFANFSLLHAPKAAMPDHLSRISTALKANGVFHIGLKTGEGERRDAIGRFYAYYDVEELRGLLLNADFNVMSERTGADAGLDGTVAPWVVMLCRKIR